MNASASSGEKAWRAAVFWFDAAQQPRSVTDGLLERTK